MGSYLDFLHGLGNSLGNPLGSNYQNLQNQLQNNASVFANTIGLQSQQNIFASQRYHVEEDFCSPSYIRREWDEKFCKVMGWDMDHLRFMLDMLKHNKTLKTNEASISYR